MQLSEGEIQKIMSMTGGSRTEILNVAGYMPELGQWLKWGIVKTWSCARALTCLGPIRKIYWAIVCVKTTIPISSEP